MHLAFRTRTLRAASSCLDFTATRCGRFPAGILSRLLLSRVGGHKVSLFLAPISIKGYHCALVQINLQSSAGTAATSVVPWHLILLNLLDQQLPALGRMQTKRCPSVPGTGHCQLRAGLTSLSGSASFQQCCSDFLKEVTFSPVLHLFLLLHMQRHCTGIDTAAAPQLPVPAGSGFHPTAAKSTAGGNFRGCSKQAVTSHRLLLSGVQEQWRCQRVPGAGLPGRGMLCGQRRM